ncbi:MAG: alpha/beta hydrolase [Halioglobus sp.]|nr:alpha/beta hydrolase [Halioglobus sp.]
MRQLLNHTSGSFEPHGTTYQWLLQAVVEILLTSKEGTRCSAQYIVFQCRLAGCPTATMRASSRLLGACFVCALPWCVWYSVWYSVWVSGRSLDRLGLQPPYVLVGHSIGVMYMELYARTYPDEVAGLVFVDARHVDFTGRCLAQGARWCEPPPLLEAMLPPVARRELAGESATRQEISRAGPVPDVPVVVLTGMNKPLEGERFRAVWLATQRELASVSAAARHDICERCGHYLHRDDPDRVVNAILSVVDEARRRTAGVTP